MRCFTLIGSRTTGDWQRCSALRRATAWSTDFATRSCGIAPGNGSRGSEIQRNNLLFHKESQLLAHKTRPTPAIGELVLRTAHNLIVENDDVTDTLIAPADLSRPEVM